MIDGCFISSEFWKSIFSFFILFFENLVRFGYIFFEVLEFYEVVFCVMSNISFNFLLGCGERGLYINV